MLRAKHRLALRVKLPVKPRRSKPLVVAVIAISVAMIILTRGLAALRHDGLVSLQAQQILGFSAFGVNAAISILGFWTPHRAAWAAYLVVSVLAFVLIGAATPLTGLWILLVVAYDSLAHG
jgi:hypothetical protein